MNKKLMAPTSQLCFRIFY